MTTPMERKGRLVISERGAKPLATLKVKKNRALGFGNRKSSNWIKTKIIVFKTKRMHNKRKAKANLTQEPNPKGKKILKAEQQQQRKD